jgi:hypothetical protein
MTEPHKKMGLLRKIYYAYLTAFQNDWLRLLGNYELL